MLPPYGQLGGAGRRQGHGVWRTRGKVGVVSSAVGGGELARVVGTRGSKSSQLLCQGRHAGSRHRDRENRADII